MHQAPTGWHHFNIKLKNYPSAFASDPGGAEAAGRLDGRDILPPRDQHHLLASPSHQEWNRLGIRRQVKEGGQKRKKEKGRKDYNRYGI